MRLWLDAFFMFIVAVLLAVIAGALIVGGFLIQEYAMKEFYSWVGLVVVSVVLGTCFVRALIWILVSVI
jgi:hypothetical protein